jgi:hypothetical protein
VDPRGETNMASNGDMERKLTAVIGNKAEYLKGRRRRGNVTDKKGTLVSVLN